MIQEKTLVKGVRVGVQIPAAAAKGEVEEWRIILDFISDWPDRNRKIKDYYVWVTSEYLVKKADSKADQKSAEKFALKVAQKRFNESGKVVPVENGIYYSIQQGEVIIDPRSFSHPLEQNAR